MQLLLSLCLRWAFAVCVCALCSVHVTVSTGLVFACAWRCVYVCAIVYVGVVIVIVIDVVFVVGDVVVLHVCHALCNGHCAEPMCQCPLRL